MNDRIAEFLQHHHQTILATIRKDGRPQLSNVLSAYDDGALLISTTEDRAKFRNMQRDPRVTLLILGDNFWQYVVVYGEAEITRLPEALPLLRHYYEIAAGPHPNWEEYDQAMRAERRALVRVPISRVIPFLGG